MNTNFKVIGLTRLGIKVESIPKLIEADALSRPSEVKAGIAQVLFSFDRWFNFCFILIGKFDLEHFN